MTAFRKNIIIFLIIIRADVFGILSKTTEKFCQDFRINEGIRIPVCFIAAPWIIRGGADPRLPRVVENIAEYDAEGFITFDRPCDVPALEKVPRPLILPVEPDCVIAGKSPHEQGDIPIIIADEKMDMVLHQAESADLDMVLTGVLLHQVEKMKIIRPFFKNDLFAVPPQDDVIITRFADHSHHTVLLTVIIPWQWDRSSRCKCPAFCLKSGTLAPAASVPFAIW